MIRLERVSKIYDDKRAVDELDLTIPRGSIFGLIGPNGAGKTTTLGMIATLIKSDEGRIEVDGLDVRRDVRQVRRRLGYMPDSFGVFRGLTCEEYLRFFGRIFDMRGLALESRLDDVLALTELERVRDQLTTSLSMGMKQRLSLAKTLLHDPDLLILDEPASGLDPRARIEIRSLLRELGTMGKTIVISSHILADLEEICSDVAIIEEGQLAWGGSLRDFAEIQRDHVDVRIQVPEADTERARALLTQSGLIDKLRLDGQRLLGSVAVGETNRLLRCLLDADIEVLVFSQEKANLETLFLESTRGIVS